MLSSWDGACLRVLGKFTVTKMGGDETRTYDSTTVYKFASAVYAKATGGHSSSPDDVRHPLAKGAEVEGRYESGQWYPAVIAGVRQHDDDFIAPGETCSRHTRWVYTLDWSDGDPDQKIQPDRNIRHLPPPLTRDEFVRAIKATKSPHTSEDEEARALAADLRMAQALDGDLAARHRHLDRALLRLRQRVPGQERLPRRGGAGYGRCLPCQAAA